MQTRMFAVELVMPNKQYKQVAAVTVSGHIVHGVSQYLDIKDENGDTLVTLTWKSSVRLREVK
ncbi:MAG: hypothetical protein HRJ53_07500 [Acidobacteria bacterium Pan2503]|uniref:Uncharacterized protein n=1 Tax=Candidatus Acidiferrum panamense TaxID=2741543 RepID=A0A7V8SWE8_9BACT|nr:hypothetical protein [Candidatus Acidoferrum panamensis]